MGDTPREDRSVLEVYFDTSPTDTTVVFILRSDLIGSPAIHSPKDWKSIEKDGSGESRIPVLVELPLRKELSWPPTLETLKINTSVPMHQLQDFRDDFRTWYMGWGPGQKYFTIHGATRV